MFIVAVVVVVVVDVLRDVSFVVVMLCYSMNAENFLLVCDICTMYLLCAENYPNTQNKNKQTQDITNKHTYIHTYIHTYTHTYIHTLYRYSDSINLIHRNKKKIKKKERKDIFR